MTQSSRVPNVPVVRPTFFRSAARSLHVPARLTPEPARHEARGAPDQRTAGSCAKSSAGRATKPILQLRIGAYRSTVLLSDMALVHLYLDESGHSTSHRFVVLGGLIGVSEAWDGFAERWNAILGEHRVTPPFHMKDFEAKRRQFKGWDEETQRRPLMKALMDEIGARRVFLFGAAVSVQWFKGFDWRSGFPGAEPLEDPYHLAMQDVVREAVRVCNTGVHVPATGNKLVVVMSEQKEFQGVAAAYYRAAARFDVTGTLMERASFCRPTECPALQAADIAAFELRWRLTRPDISRYPWKRLTDKPGDNIYLRGIDSRTVFPERTYQADDYRTLVLRDSNDKGIRNQGKHSRGEKAKQDTATEDGD